MAAANLLALIDDIATVLDDVAILSKVAAKKTAGVLGDDLALNAQQVSGVRAEREIPVVWAVAKGSLVNKAILVPAALLISAFAPWLVLPLLMVGGAFLCFEGFEKLAHKLLHARGDDAAEHQALTRALADPQIDLVAFERDKIKGAVRTDFILSAEIIAITLGAVAGAAFGTQVAVLAGIALVMTIGVYGIVAGIVKLDDLGLWLSGRPGAARQVQPGVVELDDAGDEAVHAHRHQQRDAGQHRDAGAEGRAGHRAQRDRDDLGRQHEVGADRALDPGLLESHRVHRRVGQRARARGVLRVVLVAPVQEAVRQLLEAFVAEEGAADHQQRRHQPRREGADRQRQRHQDRLVQQRALGHRPHHRQLALRRHAADLLRVQRQVVAEHAGGLLRRHLGERGHVVQHAGDVVDQRDQAGAGHRALPLQPRRAAM